MKKPSHILIIILLQIGLIGIYSCKEEPANPELPFTYDVSVLLNTHVYKFESGKPQMIRYYLDIALIKGAYTADSISELTDMPDTNFIFKDYYFNNSLIHYQITKIEYLDSTSYPTYYHAIMIDQSNSLNTYDMRDPYNYRFENINAYLKNLNGEGNVILSAYARNGELEDNVLTIYGEKFINKWNKEISTNLLNLTHKTAGTSSQYDALYNMIEFMAENSPDSNRSISIFILNKDDGKGTHSLDEIINLALINHVKINPVFLSYSTDFIDFKSMLKLANATGGYVELGGIWQLSSSFFILNKILKRQLYFYRVYVTQTIAPPNWFLGPHLDYLTIRFDTNRNHNNQINFLLEQP